MGVINFDGLTIKEKLWIDFYIQNRGNAMEAARMAGYSARSCGTIGAQNAVRLKKQIGERLKELMSSIDHETYSVVQELRRLAFSDLRNVAEWDEKGIRLKASAELTEDAAAAIDEISFAPGKFGNNIKIKNHSKTTAIGLYMRWLGMINEDPPPMDDATRKSEKELREERRARMLMLQEKLHASQRAAKEENKTESANEEDAT